MQGERVAVVDGDEVAGRSVVVDDVKVQLEGFYRDVLWALAGHMHTGGTAQGAPVVVKRVALAWGLDVGGIPLPRLSRKQYREMKEQAQWRG